MSHSLNPHPVSPAVLRGPSAPVNSPSKCRGSLWGGASPQVCTPAARGMARVSARTDLWLGAGLSDRDLGLRLPCAPYPKALSPSLYPSELLAAKKGAGPASRRNVPFSAPRNSLLGHSLVPKAPESPPGSPP